MRTPIEKIEQFAASLTEKEKQSLRETLPRKQPTKLQTAQQRWRMRKGQLESCRTILKSINSQLGTNEEFEMCIDWLIDHLKANNDFGFRRIGGKPSVKKA